MDWSIVLSVILGLFLFNILRGSLFLIIGLVKMRNPKTGDVEIKPRSTL